MLRSPASIRLLGAIVALATLAACRTSSSPGAPPVAVALDRGVLVDSARLMFDISALAADSMEGRAPGTPGHERARSYIRSEFVRIGLRPFGTDLAQRFEIVSRRDSTRMAGINLVGWIPGTTDATRYIVVTAHYDHVGVRDGEIYNGADDNASGTAGLLAIAEHFALMRPTHSIIFAALDAEEQGLQGARAFVATPPVPLDRIVLNVNMDMVSRSATNELYAAGTSHYPFLAPYVDSAAAEAGVTLRRGHDTPVPTARDDWTTQSDHGAFHARGVPFLYFGVEDHPGYHRPSDDVEAITPAFYVRAVSAVLRTIELLDRNLPTVVRAAGRN